MSSLFAMDLLQVSWLHITMTEQYDLPIDGVHCIEQMLLADHCKMVGKVRKGFRLRRPKKPTGSVCCVQEGNPVRCIHVNDGKPKGALCRSCIKEVSPKVILEKSLTSHEESLIKAFFAHEIKTQNIFSFEFRFYSMNRILYIEHAELQDEYGFIWASPELVGTEWGKVSKVFTKATAMHKASLYMGPSIERRAASAMDDLIDKVGTLTLGCAHGPHAELVRELAALALN